MQFLSSLILVFLIPISLFAQSEDELQTYKNTNYIKEYIPETPKEIKLSGNTRMAFAYYSAMAPTDFGKISDIEFQFGYNVGKFWLEAVFGQGKAQFGSISTNSTQVGSSSSEGNFSRDDELEESYLYMGIGASLKSKHLSDFFGFDRVFETFSGYLTYHTMTEELRQEDYAGFGGRADAAINYRLSEKSHIGLRFSFGYSALRRAEAFQGEAASQRSLLFYWNRIGADYSFYF